jgi:hypothetical protein
VVKHVIQLFQRLRRAIRHPVKLASTLVLNRIKPVSASAQKVQHRPEPFAELDRLARG